MAFKQQIIARPQTLTTSNFHPSNNHSNPLVVRPNFPSHPHPDLHSPDTKPPENVHINLKQTEQEKVENRNKKGRERSMRTRKRNASRQKNLRDNCAYLEKENAILRHIAAIIQENADWPTICSLIHSLIICRRTRPPLYLLTSAAIKREAANLANQPQLQSPTPIQPAPQSKPMSNALESSAAPHHESEMTTELHTAVKYQTLIKKHGTCPNSVTDTQTVGLQGNKGVPTTRTPVAEQFGHTTSTNERLKAVLTNEAHWPCLPPGDNEVGPFFVPLTQFQEFDLVDNPAVLSRLTVEDIIRIIRETPVNDSLGSREGGE